MSAIVTDGLGTVGTPPAVEWRERGRSAGFGLVGCRRTERRLADLV